MKLKYKIYSIISLILAANIAFAITIIPTAMGEIKIKEKPIRVITLEHRYTEMALGLGVAPVGVADIKSYKNYDGVLANGLNQALNVGRREAPNIETIARLRPDIIIGARLRNANAFPILSKIARTLLFNYIEISKTRQSPLQEMAQEFNLVAKALEKEKQAKIVLSKYNKIIEEDKQKISRLKQQGLLKSNKIAIAQFLPGSPKIRLFTTDSVAMNALVKVGLQPAWNVKGGDSNMGYLTVSINTLQSLGDFNFFYFNERSDQSQLKQTFNSKVWQSFNFVKSGSVYSMKEKTWPWGGPIAVADFISQVTSKLEKEAYRK